MAKTFVIKTKSGQTYGPYTMDDAKAANMASQAAMKGDSFIEVPTKQTKPVRPSPAVKPPVKMDTGTSTTAGPAPQVPPTPVAKPESALLPPQTGPEPLAKEKEKIMKEQAGTTRSFLGGLADGLTLGVTLDDISKVQDEGSPVPYQGGRFAGEALANVGAEAAIAAATRGRLNPRAIAATAGGLTGAIASGVEKYKETGEVSPGDILTGGLTGAAGGYAGAFIGAPKARKIGKEAGKVLEPLLGTPGVAGPRATAKGAAEKQARLVEERAVETMRGKTRAEIADEELKLRQKARKTFNSNLSEQDKTFLKQAEQALEDGAIDPEEILAATGGLSGKKSELNMAVFTAAQKARELAQQANLLAKSEEQAREEFRRLVKEVDVPKNFRNFLEEYADFYLTGAAGSTLTSRSPELAARAKETAEQLAATVGNKPVNATIRQKQAMEALQRLAEIDAAEKRKKEAEMEEYKRTGRGRPATGWDIAKSALLPK